MKDINRLLFNINIPGNSPPASGRLLVAEPFLSESYFNHAVILLVDHEDSEGSMGIVLNRPTEYSLTDLIDGIGEGRHIPVYCGGPVDNNRLFFIHTLGDFVPGGRELVPGLWVGGDFEAMTDFINSGESLEGRARFFLGYSGWSKGQLGDEIKAGTWAGAPLPQPIDQILMGSGDTFWHRVVRSLGQSYRGWLYHPQYPILN